MLSEELNLLARYRNFNSRCRLSREWIGPRRHCVLDFFEDVAYGTLSQSGHRRLLGCRPGTPVDEEGDIPLGRPGLDRALSNEVNVTPGDVCPVDTTSNSKDSEVTAKCKAPVNICTEESYSMYQKRSTLCFS